MSWRVSPITNAPRFGMISMSPSSSSFWNASRTGVLLTLYSLQIRFSVSFSPASILPCRISSLSLLKRFCGRESAAFAACDCVVSMLHSFLSESVRPVDLYTTIPVDQNLVKRRLPKPDKNRLSPDSKYYILCFAKGLSLHIALKSRAGCAAARGFIGYTNGEEEGKRHENGHQTGWDRGGIRRLED